MNKFAAYILTLCLLCCTTLSSGQNFPMLHFTVEDGLPSNVIYYIYKDSKGYLWLATDKGIARYNGIKFEIFTTFNGMADNEIFFFQEDNYGRLWLGTYNGALCYYQNDTFHTSENTPFLKLPFKASHIGIISVEKDSSVIIGFQDRSKFINIRKNEVRIINIEKINDPDIKTVFYRKKIETNKYELICLHNIYVIDSSGSVISKNPVNNLSGGRYSFCQNQNYLFTENIVYNADLQPIHKLPNAFLTTRSIYEIYTDDDKRMFYATSNGLYINDSLNILKEEKTSAVTQDALGNYWVSTLENGIFEIKKGFINTKLYPNCYKNPVGYAYADSKHIFFTTIDKNIYRLENGKINCLFNYEKFTKKPASPNITDPASLIYNNYHYINFHAGNIISVANLLAPKIKMSAIKNYYEASKALFYVDSSLYIKGISSIAKLEKINQPLDSQITQKPIIFYTNNERIFGMAQSHDKHFWYSTINSVYKLQNDTPVLQTQFHNLTFKSFCFAGDYLIGYTQYNQLMVCSNYSGKVSVDTIAPQNCIWNRFYKIDTNHILISTNNLYRMLSLYPSLSLLTIENAVIPLRAEAICSDRTNCYFFKNGSITSIDINSMLVKPAPPKLFFSVLKTGKGTYHIQDDMEFPFADSRNISISFSTLSLNGKDVSYQYSAAKSTQDNWRDITGEINLTHPVYGSYVIKVRAKTISSEYSEPIVFTLHILKPFWASWWFLILSNLLALVLIWLAISYILNQREKHHKEKIKFLKSEYKALNALMNPHFIFNTLNSVQGLINENNKRSANEYLRTFSNLIRQNMQNISLELIPLHREIELLENYLKLEKLRFKELLNYSIEIEEDVDTESIMIPPLLVQPLVENSIKHGLLPKKSPDNFVSVRIYQENEWVYIEVSDNGIGINHAIKKMHSRYQSYGLENIKKRIAQLELMQNTNISFSIIETHDQSGNITGTKAIISIQTI